MPDIVISNTSCFIVLIKISELGLLHNMYGEIITSPEVAAEYSQTLPEWVKIKSPSDRFSQQILELQLDKGEASVIALAIETPNSTIILDDYKARLIAEKLGLKITGTLGIIIKAKLRGIIPSIKPYLEKIRNTDFRLNPEIVSQAFREAEELE
jgi:predicted nucleic acid-binding protein